MSKEQNQKKRNKPIKPGHKVFELGYQSPLERLLAEISIKLNALQFIS